LIQYGQSSLDPRTDFAEIIQGLYVNVFWWAVLILTVVWGLLIYILIRYRERPGTPHPKQSHGNLLMEIAWTLGPAAIVVAILVPTVKALFATQRPDASGSYEIEVIGHQFWWEFKYPEGVVTANELHLPVGRAVSLRLSSVDVIHSFWVPQLGGKRDLNPLVTRPEGVEQRYNWLHFTVREPGIFRGQCAEFCGLSHALMGTYVVAESDADFQAWLAAWGPTAPASGPQIASPAAPDTTAAGMAAANAAAAGTAAAGTTGAAPAPTGDSAAAAAARGSQPPQSTASTPPAGALPPATLPATPQANAASTAQPGEDPQVTHGRQIFLSSVCLGCHAIQGTTAQSPVGPNLTLFGRRKTLGAGWLENTQENVERWITNPAGVKPGVKMPGIDQTGLTPEQVRAVAAYLRSLQ
jgi:cytochrome c oxidase subunit II